MALGKFKKSTTRMLLREFVEADAEPLYQLNTHPDVLRYTGDEPFSGTTDAVDFIRNYTHYRDHGFGRWAVEDLESGRFMGFAGLRFKHQTGEVDVAFRLFPQYWDSGYATEAARACMQAGFGPFELKEIFGLVMRENLPSISVLQKLGMRFRRMDEYEGRFWLVYGLEREDFDWSD